MQKKDNSSSIGPTNQKEFDEAEFMFSENYPPTKILSVLVNKKEVEFIETGTGFRLKNKPAKKAQIVCISEIGE